MSKHHLFQISLFMVYVLVVLSFMIWQGVGIDPSRFIVFLFFPALLLKRTRQFLLDWLPFLFIFLAYEFLRGLTPILNPRADYLTPLHFDTLIGGGQIPTITLQKLLFDPSNISLLPYLSSMLYFVHLALPFVFGYVLWINNRDQFKRFTTGIIFLSYSGWLTYLVYPAAPPWLASQKGFLPYVYRVVDFTSQNFPEKIHAPSIYHDFYPNNVAAVPSMHAAYPMLVLLYGLKFFKKKFLLFGIYPLAVWFSLVFLGEHYVFDEIIGIIYAVVAFLVAEFLHKHQQQIATKALRILHLRSN